MSSLITCLKESVDLGKGDRIKENLSVLSVEKNLQVADDDIFAILLNHEDTDILKLCAQIVADLTKAEQNRRVFSNDRTIKALLKLLQHSDENVKYQSLRALGNICYENEPSCKIVGEDGLKILINVMQNNPKGSNITVASGFLVNLLAPCESLQKISLKHKIMEVLETVLVENVCKVDENDFLFTNLLTVLNVLLEFLEETNVVITKTLCSVVVESLKTSANPEVCSLCLDVLHVASENKELKALVAEKGVCQLIFKLVEKYGNKVDDEESRSVLKTACDLIVVILTEDECMDLLYNNGEGEVYKNMLSWLKSTDGDLLITGVLAVGNFARKDQHCLQMVERGVAKTLLGLLSKYNNPEDDVKLQHALLSTLRNLAIPQKNKEKLLNDGLIKILYPLTKSDQYLVVFKLLGTLRMVIDGQEDAAFTLLKDENFLKRLIFWCYNSDHLGVRGEVPRLIAWLIKNCASSSKTFAQILTVNDCVRCLAEMISSNHAVMQNEACYALVSLAVAFIQDSAAVTDKFYKLLEEADVGKQVFFTLSKYGEKMDSKTVQNIITLLEHLVVSKGLAVQFKACGLEEELGKLQAKGDGGELQVRVKQVVGVIRGQN